VKISAVIPATDAPLTLTRCIAAIEAGREPPEEVIVIETPPGAGPSEARNIGAGRASGDVLVFVDADVEVHSDAFARIRAAFDGDLDLVAVFGSYDDDPAAGSLVSDFRNLLHHYVHQKAAGQATTFWAGLGSIRRSDFLALEGFDEKRFPRASVEDIDLGMRLASEGKRIVLDPSIQGKHLKRWTLRSMIQTDLVRRGVPWVRVLLEKRVSSDALNLGWPYRVSAGASVALVVGLITRRTRVAGAGGIVLIALNSNFYGLLFRRRGLTQAALGIPLHVLHHLISVAAVPIGLSQHLRAVRSRSRAR
jgi:glycosyltransferase involved in cell wall biosynthesis